MTSDRLDPITFEVVKNALDSLVDESIPVGYHLAPDHRNDPTRGLDG